MTEDVGGIGTFSLVLRGALSSLVARQAAREDGRHCVVIRRQGK